MPAARRREPGRTLRGSGPFIVVLAGPNGAGKSSFFELHLAHLDLPFVNADRIARELSPEDPTRSVYAAAAEAAAERRRFVARGRSFVTETVFSDPVGEKLALLRDAREAGYAVILVFIGLDGPELCTARVAQRVEEGGHDVPDEKISARYPRTLSNLRAALPIADAVLLFDNGSADDPYRCFAWYREGQLRRRRGRVPAWAEGLPGLGPAKALPRRGTGTRSRRSRGRAASRPGGSE